MAKTNRKAAPAAVTPHAAPTLPAAAVETIRGIDQVVQDTAERLYTLCRSAQQRLLCAGERRALTDAHELLDAIVEAMHDAENYVNAEAETLGAVFVDAKRRALESALLREGGAA